MTPQNVHKFAPVTIVAVATATVAALIARSWLQLRLMDGGMDRPVAADLSYLVVPPILVLLLFPLWKREKSFLADQFQLRDLSWRIALRALAVGILMRLLWWCQVVAGVSFGLYSSSDPAAVVGPAFSFQCQSPAVVFLGFFVMAFLVPIVEETVHRGYVQTLLRKHGAFVAILISALVFTVFHTFGSWTTVFVAGVLFGIQYWVTRSLWTSLITHATFNGLVQLDWRCLSGQWNPRPENLPVLMPGITSLVLGIVCLTLIVLLLRRMATEARHAPR